MAPESLMYPQVTFGLFFDYAQMLYEDPLLLPCFQNIELLSVGQI